MRHRPGPTTLSIQGLELPHAVRDHHSRKEWRYITTVLSVTEAADGRGLVLRPNPRYAGVVSVAGTALYSPPSVGLLTFLRLILIAHTLDRAITPDTVAAVSQTTSGDATLMELLAALMTIQARKLASGHIAQGYIARRERLSVLRGRPFWPSPRPGPDDGKVFCEYRVKTTDVPLNRAVLSGVVAASQWLHASPFRREGRTQRFVWSSIAEPALPTAGLFTDANRALNRLTDEYRGAIRIAETLVFGLGPSTINDTAGREVPAPLFDLALLFEKLVQRATSLLASQLGLRVTPQHTYHRALLDGFGNVYRRARPDLVVWDGQRPVAVFDSKFKHRYVSGGPKLQRHSRVSSSDIYQMFFYAERLKRLHGVTDLPAFIVAPQLSGSTVPDRRYRQVRWVTAGGQGASLTVLPLPMDQTPELTMRQDAAGLGDVAAELQDALAGVA